MLIYIWKKTTFSLIYIWKKTTFPTKYDNFTVRVDRWIDKHLDQTALSTRLFPHSFARLLQLFYTVILLSIPRLRWKLLSPYFISESSIVMTMLAQRRGALHMGRTYVNAYLRHTYRTKTFKVIGGFRPRGFHTVSLDLHIQKQPRVSAKSICPFSLELMVQINQKMGHGVENLLPKSLWGGVRHTYEREFMFGSRTWYSSRASAYVTVAKKCAVSHTLNVSCRTHEGVVPHICESRHTHSNVWEFICESHEGDAQRPHTCEYIRVPRMNALRRTCECVMSYPRESHICEDLWIHMAVTRRWCSTPTCQYIPVARVKASCRTCECVMSHTCESHTSEHMWIYAWVNEGDTLVVQGGENAEDAVSLHVIFRERAL